MRRDLGGQGQLELTYFNNRIRDLIGFDPTTFLPLNVNTARTSGAELSFDRKLGRGLRVVTSGTYTRANSSSGALLRRPRFNLSTDLIGQRGRYDFDLSVLAQGRRFDSDFFNDTAAREYGGFARGLQPYVRINNLLNRQYAEVAGFPAPRFNIVFGLRAF